jgi:hypothetical protein
MCQARRSAGWPRRLATPRAEAKAKPMIAAPAAITNGSMSSINQDSETKGVGRSGWMRAIRVRPCPADAQIAEQMV